MSTETAGIPEVVGSTRRSTPVRSNVVAAHEGRTPQPLNIVGEETLVSVDEEIEGAGDGRAIMRPAVRRLHPD